MCDTLHRPFFRKDISLMVDLGVVTRRHVSRYPQSYLLTNSGEQSDVMELWQGQSQVRGRTAWCVVVGPAIGD